MKKLLLLALLGSLLAGCDDFPMHDEGWHGLGHLEHGHGEGHYAHRGHGEHD